MTPAAQEPGEQEKAATEDPAASTASDDSAAPKRVEWSTADLARAAGQRMGSRLSDEILKKMSREDSEREQDEYYARTHDEFMARMDAEYAAQIEEERRAAREAAGRTTPSPGSVADPRVRAKADLLDRLEAEARAERRRISESGEDSGSD
jgi:hypothetical protein